VPDYGGSDDHMMWAQLVAKHLKPSFGGFATFCYDPDDLLENPNVREQMNAHKLVIEEWSGARDELFRWIAVADDATPIVKVASGAPRHFIDEILPDAVVIDIGVSMIFPRLDADVVRAVPNDQWDVLVRLQDRERPMRTRRETALMVARAVYGVDPVFVREHGWNKAIREIATSGTAIPPLIACELASEINDDPTGELVTALQDLAVARHLLKSRGKPTTNVTDSAINRRVAREHRTTAYQESSILLGWQNDLTPTDVQRLSFDYAALVADGLPEKTRRACNERFQAWIERTYDQIHSSQNQEVLRIQQIVDVVDSRVGSGRAILLVVDALGLEAWIGLKGEWLGRGVFKSAVEASAFAILPTLTSLSRRALFERRIPPNFDPAEEHSQALERKLWHQRFPEGKYFEVGEIQAIKDAIYQGCQRLAVVDVSWDRRGHALDPEMDSLSHQAAVWGGKQQPAGIVSEALANGYRVFVTADHGQVDGVGIGRPNVGIVPEERSKRVIMFASGTPVDAYAQYGETRYQPITLPRGRSAVFAPYGDSFGDRGTSAFSHGGMTIEEVMIPFVELKA